MLRNYSKWKEREVTFGMRKNQPKLALVKQMLNVSTNFIKPCQNEETYTCIVGHVKQADCEHVTVKTLRLF